MPTAYSSQHTVNLRFVAFSSDSNALYLYLYLSHSQHSSQEGPVVEAKTKCHITSDF